MAELPDSVARFIYPGFLMKVRGSAGASSSARFVGRRSDSTGRRARRVDAEPEAIGLLGSCFSKTRRAPPARVGGRDLICGEQDRYKETASKQ